MGNFFLTSRHNLPEKGQYQASKRVKEAIGKVLGTEGKSSTNDGSVEVKRRKIEKSSKSEKIAIQPPKDWKSEEQIKQEEAKKKAAEVMKKLREIAPSKKKRQNKRYQIKRQVLNKHNLSESESD